MLCLQPGHELALKLALDVGPGRFSPTEIECGVNCGLAVREEQDCVISVVVYKGF